MIAVGQQNPRRSDAGELIEIGFAGLDRVDAEVALRVAHEVAVEVVAMALPRAVTTSERPGRSQSIFLLPSERLSVMAFLAIRDGHTGTARRGELPARAKTGPAAGGLCNGPLARCPPLTAAGDLPIGSFAARMTGFIIRQLDQHSMVVMISPWRCPILGKRILGNTA